MSRSKIHCIQTVMLIQDANLTANSDQVILVGAASKGIIQRNYQHNATVYKTPYAKNPFDAVTDEEIQYYKNSVERGGQSIILLYNIFVYNFLGDFLLYCILIDYNVYFYR